MSVKGPGYTNLSDKGGLRSTEKGVGTDIRIYTYDDGHGNLIVLDANGRQVAEQPFADGIELVAVLATLLRSAERAARNRRRQLTLV